MSTTTERRVPVTGNTYPVREQIKALGSTWDKRRKAWLVPESRVKEAEALVASAPRGDDGMVDVFVFSSGHTATRRRGGRCEDAPCCGCCTI